MNKILNLRVFSFLPTLKRNKKESVVFIDRIVFELNPLIEAHPISLKGKTYRIF